MRLLYFAWVREAIGAGEEQVTPPASVATIDGLIDWLVQRGEPYAAVFADRDRLRAAVDGVFTSFDAPIVSAEEVAIFPPVTGG